MKRFIVLAVLFFATVAINAKPEEDKFENVDVDKILQNRRLLLNYVNCLLSKGKCSPDALELKTKLPDALKEGCSKCTDKQKDITKRVLRFLIKNEPELWAALSIVYDPTGEYTNNYRAEAKKEGIEI